MANPEHLGMLDKGAEAWNDWMRSDSGLRPDLSIINLSSRVFRGYNFSGTNFADSNLREADLSDSILIAANLNKCELYSAKLTNTNIDRSTFISSDLWNADCRYVVGRADFSSANLINCNFEGASVGSANFLDANLHMANLKYANFSGAIFKRTNCYSVNFQFSNLREAKFYDASLRSADIRFADLTLSMIVKTNLLNIRYNRWARYRGIRLSENYASERFVEHAKYQDYIEELRDLRHNAEYWSVTGYKTMRYPIIGPLLSYLTELYKCKRSWRFWFKYLPWLIFVDCGRTLTLWLIWTASIIFIFGFVYSGYSTMPWLPTYINDVLINIKPSLAINRDVTSFTPYYLSVITFSTLGFGDIVPVNMAGEVWVTVEVLLGYLMLGGLLTILANKLIKR